LQAVSSGVETSTSPSQRPHRLAPAGDNPMAKQIRLEQVMEHPDAGDETCADLFPRKGTAEL